MTLLSDNGVSKVTRDGEWCIKEQPMHLTDNEIYALRILYKTGFVPFAERVNLTTIKIRYLPNEPITDCEKFRMYCHLFLDVLEQEKLRHGDLTEYAIRVVDNQPHFIDWAESRVRNDPRPDKRREGDKYWLERTMNKLCQKR